MGTVAILGTRGYPSYYGGFETAVRKLAPHLADAGWDVTVYGRPNKSSGPGPADARVKRVVTRGIESRSLSTLSFGLTSTFHAMIRKPDVALVMNVANGFWLPLLKIRGIPTIVNVDGMEWERAKWGKFAKKIFLLGAKLTGLLADHIVVDSLEIGRRWREEFGREGEFIPYGGDVESARRAPAGFAKGEYILLVARFVPENSVAEFFEAAADLAEHFPVVLVGSTGYGGPLDDQARLLDENHPNVTWLGHVSDDETLHSLWQNAGVYFHGHSVGGTNPALVQAMACGVPTVARDTVYNREVLGDCGVFVLPAGKGIAQQIRHLMTDADKRQVLGEAVKNRAAELYSWRYVCDSYEALLTKASAGARRS